MADPKLQRDRRDGDPDDEDAPWPSAPSLQSSRKGAETNILPAIPLHCSMRRPCDSNQPEENLSC